MTSTDTRKPFERDPDKPETERWSHANGGSGLTRCGGCTDIWWQSGNYTSHCGMCHRTFTSLAGFDAHHTHDGDRLICLDPGEMLDSLGRVRFGIAIGHHHGETVSGYWELLSADAREPLRPVSTVVTASQGVSA